MTKKHYEAIAAQIRIVRSMTKDVVARRSLEQVVQNLVFFFTQDNKNFDRTRFLEACAIENTTGENAPIVVP